MDYPITRFEVQQIVEDLIDNVEEPKTLSGHAFEYSVYKKWAGKELLRFIFDELDHMDVMQSTDVYNAIKIFRDKVSKYAARDSRARDVFAPAIDMADNVLDVFNSKLH